MKTITLEEALKLEAGPTLDALVAEKVMGFAVLSPETCVNADGCWTAILGTSEDGWACGAEKRPLIIRPEFSHLDTEPDEDDDAEHKEFYARNGHNFHAAEMCPHYSTDIAAAWEVVEKMRADGWSFACSLYHEEVSHASFCKKSAASSKRADCDPLTLAICRAALRACWQS